MDRCLDFDQQDSVFKIKGGCLFYKDKYYVSENSTLIPKILWEFHDSKLGGHAGILRTSKRISKYFFWTNMRKRIKDYVNQCMVC